MKLWIGLCTNLANQVAVFPCNTDGTMMGDEDDDPFVEDPSELVCIKWNNTNWITRSLHLRLEQL